MLVRLPCFVSPCIHLSPVGNSGCPRKGNSPLLLHQIKSFGSLVFFSERNARAELKTSRRLSLDIRSSRGIRSVDSSTLPSHRHCWSRARTQHSFFSVKSPAWIFSRNPSPSLLISCKSNTLREAVQSRVTFSKRGLSLFFKVSPTVSDDEGFSETLWQSSSTIHVPR